MGLGFRTGENEEKQKKTKKDGYMINESSKNLI